MSTEITDYDTSEYLENEQDIIAYLKRHSRIRRPRTHAGRTRQRRQGSRHDPDRQGRGRGRESLYKSLSKDGNPSFQTIAKVIHALGGRLTIQAA